MTRQHDPTTEWHRVSQRRNFSDLSVNPEIKILYTIVPGIKILYQLENKDSVLLCVLCGVNVKQLNIAKQR